MVKIVLLGVLQTAGIAPAVALQHSEIFGWARGAQAPGSQVCEAPCTCECPEEPCEEDGSCEAWADPHISGFDNEAVKGPDYLSLMADGGRDGSSSAFRTFFATFDKRRSELYRRPKKTNKTGNATKLMAQNEDTNKAGQDAPEEHMDVNAYDSGDFWLVKSLPIHIQGRFRLAQEFLPDNAAIGAIAVGGPFMEGHTLLIEPLDGDAMLDGVPLPTGDFQQTSEAGTLSMKKFDSPTDKPGQEYSDFKAELPMGVKLNLRRWKRHLDIKIALPKNIPGGVDGECGNMNGDASDDGQNHIKERMGDLEIKSDDKLFQKSFLVRLNFDKDGFQAVQATKQNRTMARFVRDMLATRGAQLMSESDLSGILPYYTGQEGTRSYEDLLAELADAEWVKGYESDNSWFFGPVSRILDQVRRSIGLDD